MSWGIGFSSLPSVWSWRSEERLREQILKGRMAFELVMRRMLIGEENGPKISTGIY